MALSESFCVCFMVVLGLVMTPVLSGKEKDKSLGIVLVAVGNLDVKDLAMLRNDLSRIFNTDVSVGKKMSEPHYAFNRKRNQYHSTAILETLLSQKEYAPYEKILGIVDRDLYVPELNFVFGEATRKAAVISLVRLKQEFYGLRKDDNVFERRVLTEAVHELGHTYGLGHCENPRCVMFFSNTLLDTDRKGSEFCSKCKLELS